ncbi:MAG: DUF2909 domain-containing protein [Agarilytica sp.]
MGIKILIIAEFIALVVALSSGLTFLLKDTGIPESKRTLYALGTRIGLATIMMLTIAYGIHSGQLTNKAPWAEHRYAPNEITKDQ